MLKKLFLDLLQEKSITPDAKNCFDITKKFLDDFDCEFINKEDTSNQILSKTFSNTGIHFAFCGHIDVVPPGDGWENEPFTPIEKDGIITARGTQDMKSGVAAFLHACKFYNGKNIRKISIILTSDEEGDGKNGTILALNHLKQKNDLPDLAIVAEPTCEKYFGDSIKVGRRGSIHANIKIIGKQGHAAYPNKCINPVHIGANALALIAGKDLDNGNDFFEPSKIVITNLKAGIGASNVTPPDFYISLNVRNSPLTSKNDIEEYLKKCLGDINYELEIKQGSEPFYTNANGKLVTTLLKSLKEMGIENTNLNTKGGTSDARLFAKFGIEVCELGVVNDKIHAVNESVEFKQVELLEECFSRLLKLLDKGE